MDENKEEKVIPKKRKISLFKRRKKPEVRPLVKQKKHEKAKKLIKFFFISVFLIFCMTALLYAARQLLLPKILNSNKEIINPQGNPLLTVAKFGEIAKESRMEATDVRFYGDVIVFKFNQKVIVYLTQKKNIKEQLVLVQAINRQITSEGKNLISVDLRYNKPIVKF